MAYHDYRESLKDRSHSQIFFVVAIVALVAVVYSGFASWSEIKFAYYGQVAQARVTGRTSEEIRYQFMEGDQYRSGEFVMDDRTKEWMRGHQFQMEYLPETEGICRVAGTGSWFYLWILGGSFITFLIGLYVAGYIVGDPFDSDTSDATYFDPK